MTPKREYCYTEKYLHTNFEKTLRTYYRGAPGEESTLYIATLSATKSSAHVVRYLHEKTPNIDARSASSRRRCAYR